MRIFKRIKKKYLILGIILIILVLGIGISFANKEENNVEENNNDNPLGIVANEYFDIHNTSERTEKIEYIVIHYTGEPISAQNFIHHYNMYNQVDSSADYFVDFDGTIYQYNMQIDERYSWAVGGEFKKGSLGGAMYGIVTNRNSINVEMCVDSNKKIEENDPNWVLSDETVNATIELVKYLMDKYGINASNVVRHYDVNGKLCPGIIGWNSESGSEEKWYEFKEKLNK